MVDYQLPFTILTLFVWVVAGYLMIDRWVFAKLKKSFPIKIKQLRELHANKELRILLILKKDNTIVIENAEAVESERIDYAQ